MDRFTHSERAERRKQINAEAHELINTMPFDSMIKFLVAKYNLTDSYVRQILPTKMKSQCKRKKEEQILKDLLDLSGSDKPSELYKKVAEKHELSQFFVAEVCRKYKIKLPQPESSLRCVSKEEQIKELIEQGMPIADIASQLNNTRENVYRYYRRMLRENKISAIPLTRVQLKRKKVKDLLKSHSQEIIDLYNSGVTVHNIAAKFDIPALNVSNYISVNNVLSSPNAPVLSNSRRKWLMVMADLFNPDLSLSDIAKKHNKPHSNVSILVAECKKLGIPLPDRIDGRTKRYLVDRKSPEVLSKTALYTSQNVSVEPCVGHAEKFIDSTSTVFIITI